MYIEVHSSTIHNSQKVERTQMSISRNGQMQCDIYIYIYVQWNVIRPLKRGKYNTVEF